MESLRKELEKQEHLHLDPRAAFSNETRGRLREMEERPGDVRTCYQRDTDRIVHCKAFGGDNSSMSNLEGTGKNVISSSQKMIT